MKLNNTSVFTLRIDGENLTSKNFPMERLAEYMALLAKLVGVVGRDAKMHITVRDYSGRIFKLSADVPTGRELARHLRGGFLRLQTRGIWHRSDKGWSTDPNKCLVI
jgi:hypothetical protein